MKFLSSFFAPFFKKGGCRAEGTTGGILKCGCMPSEQTGGILKCGCMPSEQTGGILKCGCMPSEQTGGILKCGCMPSEQTGGILKCGCMPSEQTGGILKRGCMPSEQTGGILKCGCMPSEQTGGILKCGCGSVEGYSILGIGTDLVEIARIKHIWIKYGLRFAKHILSETELIELNSSKQKVNFLAKRFAAKEAVAKALGTGFRGNVHFNQIQVEKNAFGKPEVVFLFETKDFIKSLGKKINCHISISDEKKHALAFVVLEKEN